MLCILRLFSSVHIFGNRRQKHTCRSALFDFECFLDDVPKPDNHYDAVLLTQVLEHVPDPTKVLKEIYRVLKPNGIILFTEPLNMNPFYKLYRYFNKKERTPDEHALVNKDFKIIKEKFTFEHVFLDFFSVITGYISLKIFGDKNYDNWINKIGYRLDVFFSKIPF